MTASWIRPYRNVVFRSRHGLIEYAASNHTIAKTNAIPTDYDDCVSTASLGNIGAVIQANGVCGWCLKCGAMLNQGAVDLE